MQLRVVELRAGRARARVTPPPRLWLDSRGLPHLALLFSCIKHEAVLVHERHERAARIERSFRRQGSAGPSPARTNLSHAGEEKIETKASMIQSQSAEDPSAAISVRGGRAWTLYHDASRLATPWRNAQRPSGRRDHSLASFKVQGSR